MESPSSSWYLHLIEEALVHKLLFIFLLRMLSFAPETSWPITWKSTFNISWRRSSLNIFLPCFRQISEPRQTSHIFSVYHPCLLVFTAAMYNASLLFHSNGCGCSCDLQSYSKLSENKCWILLGNFETY